MEVEAEELGLEVDDDVEAGFDVDVDDDFFEEEEKGAEWGSIA